MLFQTLEAFRLICRKLGSTRKVFSSHGSGVKKFRYEVVKGFFSQCTCHGFIVALTHKGDITSTHVFFRTCS